MKYYLYLPLFLLLGFKGLAQNEAANWYFGQFAGVRFNQNTDQVTALTNGRLNTLEGCTSISDTDGNLLFYSDGRTVWNRNHQPMPNANEGAGTGLLGDESSTSSGLIVPKPQDANFFYLFTVDEPHHFNTPAFPNQTAGNGSNDGFRYSLIDMSLQGGLGDVVPTEKNVELITYDPADPIQASYKCSEKITAVRADDCSSFWVLSHFGSNFHAFKVTETGVETTPVVSTVEPFVPFAGYRRNALGYLKASPDGTKLAVAHYGFSTQTATDGPGAVYLYDFDNDTGVVSNPVEIYSQQNNNSPYGIEFSAENRKLYATVGLGIDGNGASQVIQWDLEAANIEATAQIIHTSNSMSAGALQLSINKKIYRAQLSFTGNNTVSRFLGVINNPEADGSAANYNEQGVLLDVNGTGQNLGRIGLPPFIQSLFNSEIDIIRNGISTTELLLCDGGTFTLQGDEIPGADYTWFVDGAEIPGATQFSLTVNTPGFYQLFIEPNNGECPIEGEAIVSYFEAPVIATQPAKVELCSDSFTESFDLNTKNTEILGTLDPTTYEVLYFTSMEAAMDNLNPIMGTFTNSVNPQTIYARVQNQGNPNCFDVTNFEFEVFLTPVVPGDTTLEICDDLADPTDGISAFNLIDFDADLLGAQNASDFSVSYHNSQGDADNNANPITGTYQNTTAFNDTVFVRITNNNNSNCYSTGTVNFIINPAPEFTNSSIFQCDEDGIPDGFTLFNINQIFDVITNGQPDRSVDYYLSLSDLNSDTNPIDGNNFANFENPQTIYALVTNTLTGCTSTADVTLEVSATAANNAVLNACDDDGTEDGFYTFNLTDANEQVLQGLPAGLDIAYYETLDDALLEQNELSNNYTNTTAFNQTIFVRVENDNACFGINEVALTVFELPQIETAFETLYCLNFFPETITLDGGVINDIPNNFFYNWSTGDTTMQIQVNAPGTYTVRVTNTNGCFKDRTITVLPSNIATVENVQVTDASQKNSITVIVSGEGVYEYALESFGPYQESNTFNNLQPGIYTVYIRDRNNCGIVEEIVSVIGFPKYFTPNGDGFNDFWQVKGINRDFQPNTVVYIYDRYGKLLAQLDPLGAGWDGTFNGQLMPTNDYWFSVTLEDGRQLNGHFTLKR
jgi:gliding motility-associated-like protein